MTAVTTVSDWTALADDSTLERTVAALKGNGFSVIVVNSAEEARQKVLDLIPETSEVFTATSATLQHSGITQAINESGRFKSIRKQMAGMNRETQFLDMRR